jgi:cytochrome P450
MVASDGYSVLSNEEIFPESTKFRPERWLGNPVTANGKPLSHYLVTFGKGSRGCIGRELAMMELYVALATLFRRFDMTLYETSRDDADFVLDMVAPMPKRDSKGVRVIIKGTLT